MSAFPSLPLFTDAFIADTGHLSAQETGAYLMLMMVAWRAPDCRLPDADDKLARWARVDRRTWLRIKPIVMEFWTLADGFWTQKRLTKERDVVSKRAEAARENGRHGGRPKSLENNDTANPAGSSRVTQQKAPNPNPSPIDKSSDPNGSAAPSAAPAPDPAEFNPRKELFGRGADNLRRMTGRPKDACKALIGKWLKFVDDDALTVLRAIDEAEHQEAAHAVSFIVGHLRAAMKDHPTPPLTPHRQPSPRQQKEKRTPLSLLADQLGLSDDQHHHSQHDFGFAPVLDLAAYGGSDSPLQELLGGDPERLPAQSYPRLAYAARR